MFSKVARALSLNLSATVQIPSKPYQFFSDPKNWYINIKNKILLGASPSGGAGGAQPLAEGTWGSRPEKSKIKARNKKARERKSQKLHNSRKTAHFANGRC